MPEEELVLRVVDVKKSFGTEVVTEVLRGSSFDLRRGEFVALIGPSGSGKSTLLNLVGLLDRPTSGRVELAGQSTAALSDAELTRLRSQSLGFIFQFHHLIGALSVLENLMMPLAIRNGRLHGDHRQLAIEALATVGLAEKEQARPDQLSGGQQQRVAIARALIARPQLVLADEPTGNLDTKTADHIFSMLRSINEQHRLTFLIVTHDPRMAQRCDRVIRIEDGLIVADGPPESVLS